MVLITCTVVRICITAVYGKAGHMRQKKEAAWTSSLNSPDGDQGYPEMQNPHKLYLTEDSCIKIDYNMVCRCRYSS